MKILAVKVTLECDDTVDVDFGSPLIAEIEQAVKDATKDRAEVLNTTVTHLYSEEPMEWGDEV